MSVFRLLFSTALLCLLTACAGTPDDYDPLLDTRWALDSVYQRQTVLHDDRGVPYLELDSRSQRMSAFTGCNRVAGDYRRRGSSLRFDEITSTRMACADGTRQEQSFLRALERTARAEVTENGLLLLDTENRVLARLSAAPE